HFYNPRHVHSVTVPGPLKTRFTTCVALESLPSITIRTPRPASDTFPVSRTGKVISFPGETAGVSFGEPILSGESGASREIRYVSAASHWLAIFKLNRLLRSSPRRT